MAAEAVIDLRAKDNTRSAFASVQASLRNLKSAGEEAGKGLRKNLDLRDAGRTLAIALGASYDKIAEKVARFFTDTDEDTQKLRDQLADLSDDEVRAQARLIAARSDDEMMLKRLVVQQERLREAMKVKPTDLAGQIQQKEKSIQLMTNEVIIEELKKKMRDDEAKSTEELKRVQEELGVAQSRRYNGTVSIHQRLLGQYSLESRLMKEIAATDSKNTERQIVLRRQLADTLTNIVQLEAERDRAARQAADTISQGFEDAIMAGGKFREALRGIAQDLLRLFIRQQITAPLAAGLGDFFKGSTAFAALFGGPKALGGPVQSGTPYLVGERGPEIFMPSSSGTIVPSHRTAGAMGGASINVTYNISSGVSRAELMPILDAERKRLKAEIPDMVRRGGAYRAAFA